jgi:ATP-dependent Lon protease
MRSLLIIIGDEDDHGSDRTGWRDARLASLASRRRRRMSLLAMVAGLRAPAARGLAFSFRAIVDAQPAHSLKKTRHYSIIADSLPQPCSRLQFSPRGHLLRSEAVRLDSAPNDAGGSPAGSSPPSSSSSSSGDNPDNADPPSPPPTDSPSPPPSTSISRQSVPENYPQVLALPIARRPLFPGFYKAVVIRNPQVVAAVKEMMKRGQPYLGAFLLKDEKADSDVITDINSVHPVGVFAQITSVFAAASGPGREEEKEEGLTAVLYPHRRIKITSLVKAGGSQPSMVQLEHIEPSAASDQEQLPTPPPSPQATDSELAVGHAERHPGAPEFRAVVFKCQLTACFSTSPDILPPGS